MMALRLYNTLTRSVQDLRLRDPGRATLYCCGPTTYDAPHVGHARAALLPDLLVRRLLALGLDVTYVRNITDVDDKILKRAAEQGESPLALSLRMAQIYQQEMRAFGCLTPTHEPRVSDHIPEICALVERLIGVGAAYLVEAPEGGHDVYFSVRSFSNYGKLSRRNLSELRVGARVAEDASKRDPLDFALWKGTTTADFGFQSPWGPGRPGWHIECSAMSLRYLGHGFDVHTGGMDLIFPHHENEIAQSEVLCPGCGDFAQHWLHNGFVNVDKQKMSKSLGNFVTVRDVFERNDPEAFRWFLLGAHYRAPIQFDAQQLPGGRVVFPGIDEAEGRVDHLYGATTRLSELVARAGAEPTKLSAELAGYSTQCSKATLEAERALDDDLNTPVALAALGELSRLANELFDLAQRRRKDSSFQSGVSAVAHELREALLESASSVGLLSSEPAEYAARTRARRLRLRGLTADAIERQVEERRAARAARDFAKGDRLREELLALGITLQDSPVGTEWTIAP